MARTPYNSQNYKADEWLGPYQVNDIDEANDTKYYGYENKPGQWAIVRHVTSTGELRYSRGIGDYTQSWTDRATQSYSIFSGV